MVWPNSPSLTKSMPAFFCRATASATALLSSRSKSASSTFTPSARLRLISITLAGRGRLPAWVVLMRAIVSSPDFSPRALRRGRGRARVPPGCNIAPRLSSAARRQQAISSAGLWLLPVNATRLKSGLISISPAANSWATCRLNSMLCERFLAITGRSLPSEQSHFSQLNMEFGSHRLIAGNATRMTSVISMANRKGMMPSKI